MSALSPLRLIGNPEENFYVLGKKHLEDYKNFRLKLFGSPSLTRQIDFLTKKVRKPEAVTLPQNFWGSWLKAYCEGLEENVGEYLSFLHRIESSTLLCGSNSAFVWDKDLQTTHFLRTIDWPLHWGSEQELLYLQVPKHHSLFLHTPRGLPFLPLTLMNSKGLCLGLHRKFAQILEPQGSEIGQLSIETLMHASDCQSARKFLKGKQTLQHWGLVFLDSNHEILALDMAGPQVDAIQTPMPQDQPLCFNAAPIVKNKQISESEPAILGELCKRQRQWCLNQLTLKKEHPLQQLTRLPKLFSTGVINVHTVAALQLTATTQSLELNTGSFPTWYQGEIVSYPNVFEQHMRQIEHHKSTVSALQLELWKAHHAYSLAQRAYDEADLTSAFHHLQMGIALADSPLKGLGQWVLAFWNWSHLKGTRLRLLHYRELLGLEKSLPATHLPHLKLLKLLYEVELALAPTISPSELGEKLKVIADRSLTGQPLERAAYLKRIQARLDFQDILIAD
ncbi:MAG: hypothetical protein LW878_07200 [Proteobacteria bacterium]|nr:hypothetical protein [Pseudomonadota bacterium]